MYQGTTTPPLYHYRPQPGEEYSSYNSACDMRHVVCSMRCAACVMQYAVCGMRYAASCGMQHAVCGNKYPQRLYISFGPSPRAAVGAFFPRSNCDTANEISLSRMTMMMFRIRARCNAGNLPPFSVYTIL